MQPTITNFRKQSNATGPKAYFDVTIYEGDEAVFVLKGLALRQSQAGKWWIAMPSKQRMDRSTGQPAKDGQGNAIYDKHFDVALEKTTEGYRPTKAANRFQQRIIELALGEYEGDATANAGRGGATSAAPRKSGKLPF